MDSKACSKCGEVLPLNREHFGQKKEVRKDGSSSIRFRSECRRCMAARTREYDAANPSNVRARIERRTDRSAGNAAPMPRDLPSLRIVLKDRCRFCSEPLHGRGHVDHLTPVARGGTNKASNLTLCCESCNLAKTSKTRDEFFEWRAERGLFNRRVDISGERPDPVLRGALRERYS
ncbi:HNH endonuclease signature motif containing protein [Mesorhizobium sp. M0615]|uniref:HNH endonuclease n=1 Tax=Mesorhizobium sp. M0615 TaxID=2956971 RepID=UPI0033357B71